MQKLASGTENSRDFILDMILAHVLRVIPGNCSLFSQHAHQFTKMAPNQSEADVPGYVICVWGRTIFSRFLLYYGIRDSHRPSWCMGGGLRARCWFCRIDSNLKL